MTENTRITLSRQNIEELREKLYADGFSGKNHPGWIIVNESEAILKAVRHYNIRHQPIGNMTNDEIVEGVRCGELGSNHFETFEEYLLHVKKGNDTE